MVEIVAPGPGFINDADGNIWSADASLAAVTSGGPDATVLSLIVGLENIEGQFGPFGLKSVGIELTLGDILALEGKLVEIINAQPRDPIEVYGTPEHEAWLMDMEARGDYQ